MRSIRRPSQGGSCAVGDGDAAVVLSELWQMGTNAVGVFAVVTNRQSGRDSHQHYFVRLRRGLTGWAVVELTSGRHFGLLHPRAGAFAAGDRGVGGLRGLADAAQRLERARVDLPSLLI